MKDKDKGNEHGGRELPSKVPRKAKNPYWPK